MKALQQVGHADPVGDLSAAFALVDLPDPDPSPQDIVLEMLAVPVHGLEVRDALDRERVSIDHLPKTPGLEGCGRVVAVGSEVSDFQVGDLALPPPRSGTFRQLMCAPAAQCYRAPKTAEPEQLALVLINGMTAALLFDAYNDLAPGRWVIQNAANSSCGQWLVALIKDAGLHSINIVRRDDVFDSLYANGADACVVDRGEDTPDAFAARVEGLTMGADLHLGFDTIGGEASGRMAHCLSSEGRQVIYGNLSGDPSSFWPRDLSRKPVYVHGYRKSAYESQLTSTEKQSIYTRLCNLITEQNLRLAIAGTYALDDFTAAFEHAQRNGAARNGKVLLLPNA